MTTTLAEINVRWGSMAKIEASISRATWTVRVRVPMGFSTGCVMASRVGIVSRGTSLIVTGPVCSVITSSELIHVSRGWWRVVFVATVIVVTWSIAIIVVSVGIATGPGRQSRWRRLSRHCFCYRVVVMS